ncbi:FAD binding domain-containing protein [Desulfomonile tiedjei]|uniref:Aerobic-type carbon monoxide dehydrogenase, middle subunit CoxM/CutM-like protein n=1 Tax=Desulfomonile tiedjei (strain ATCC 49306 / DSM 6799 / DCB-1) TaxID=706587 RepID=I4CEG1_DESTA|nr:FAD binding domain-containing protein [Desulfomonile tiedjei]AFM27952.1 aerobic-type carbon monoxide dehydrogenase, middle subunit CoxM/CutM-like protein [Desulfomonile tiedjei DSM 6799]
MPQAFEELHWRRDISLKDYLVPETLSQALQMLREYKGRARIIAGGTDVIVALRRCDYTVDALVDIGRIPGLGLIEQQGDTIVLGALVTHAQTESSPPIREKAGLLATASGAVGSPQIRTVATVAGNLVSGQPAADASIPLLALDARVTVVSADGERTIPLSDFFLDVGKTVVDPTREILTRIEFKALGSNRGGCSLRLSKRKALSLPMLVCSVVVTVDDAKKTITEAAIALGPVAPTPFRSRLVEDVVKGKPATLETLQEAAESAYAYCSPRDSLLRGSCDYRQEMVKVLVKRGLRRALEDAGCVF